MTPTIRHETSADHVSVRHVNRFAFGRDDEAALVDSLQGAGYARVSLVAEVDGQVVAHILFSELPILTNTGVVSALSLAPMAVLPEHQKQGIGSALVRKGLKVCRDQGHGIVVVLGHPEFYPRFEFAVKLAESLVSPFSGKDSWLVAGTLTAVKRMGSVPDARIGNEVDQPSELKRKPAGDGCGHTGKSEAGETHPVALG